MVSWRFEVWTHPRLGTPTRVVGHVPFTTARLTDREDAGVDSSIDIPAQRTDIIYQALQVDPVTMTASRSRIIRAFRVDTTPPTLPDFEFVAADLTFSIADTGVEVARISGPDLKSSPDDARVLAFDYPAQPTRAGSWVWDGPNLFDNGALAVVSNEIQWFYIAGIGAGDTYTVTFDTQTTTALTWGADANVRRTNLIAALEALSNIANVDVIGEGTAADRFEIAFLDPGKTDLPTITVTPSVGTATVGGVATGGFASLEGWTRSYNPISGVEHGLYNEFRVTSPDLGEVGLNGSAAAVLWTSPAGAGAQYSGAQVGLGVTPGSMLQVRLRVKSSLAGRYRLVIRDMVGDTESRLGATAVTLVANTETVVTLNDTLIPADLNRVLIRFAIVDVPSVAFQCIVDELVAQEGLQGTTKGGIVLALLADLQTAHAPRTRLTWLTPSFTAAVDSSGATWDNPTVPFAAHPGQQVATHVLGGLGALNSQSDVRPTSLTAWALDLWDEGNRGVDHTGDKTIAFLTGQIAGGKYQMRLPAETAMITVGAEGVWTETVDADMVTAFGSIDGFAQSSEWLTAATTTIAAAKRLADARQNALSVQAVTTQAAGPVPWKQVSPGDRANFILGTVARHVRTIRQVVVTIRPDTWTAEWTASRIFGGESATQEALRGLLTAWPTQPGGKDKRTATTPPPASTIGATILTYTWTGDAYVATRPYGVPLMVGAFGRIRARAGTAPTGANLILDLLLNGVTSLTGGTGIVIAAGTTLSPAYLSAVAKSAAGDYVVVACTQRGSTLPGSNIVVTLEWRST